MVKTLTIGLGIAAVAAGAYYYYAKRGITTQKDQAILATKGGNKAATQLKDTVVRQKSDLFLLTGKKAENASLFERLQIPAVQATRSLGSGGRTSMNVTQTLLPITSSPEVMFGLPSVQLNPAVRGSRQAYGVGVRKTDKMTYGGPTEERLLTPKKTVTHKKYLQFGQPLWSPIQNIMGNLTEQKTMKYPDAKLSVL